MFFNFHKDLFGRSSSWKKVRDEFLKNNTQCAACGRKTRLEVHHIIPYHVDNTKELDPSNLITLCDDYCHFIFGHLGDWKSWNTDVVNDCNEYYNKRINRPHLIKFKHMQLPKEYKNENNHIHGSNFIKSMCNWWHNFTKSR